MGMFNVLRADLLCPDKKEVAKNSEIQIKWQAHAALDCSMFIMSPATPLKKW